MATTLFHSFPFVSSVSFCLFVLFLMKGKNSSLNLYSVFSFVLPSVIIPSKTGDILASSSHVIHSLKWRKEAANVDFIQTKFPDSCQSLC